MRIIDMIGNTIVDKIVMGEIMALDLSVCQFGLYNLIVDGNDGIKTCKLLKD